MADLQTLTLIEVQLRRDAWLAYNTVYHGEPTPLTEAQWHHIIRDMTRRGWSKELTVNAVVALHGHIEGELTP